MARFAIYDSSNVLAGLPFQTLKMPQPIIDFIAKMNKSQLQIYLVIISILFVTGGSHLDNRIRSIEIAQQKKAVDDAARDAREVELMNKVNAIYEHVVKKGLEG